MKRESLIYRRPVLFVLLLFVVANVICLFAILSFGLVGMAAFALNALVVPTWMGLYSYTIRQDLRSKGYHWVGLVDAWRLFARHWHWAFRIPPHNHVAQLPGYTESVDGITLALRPVMLEKLGAYTLHIEAKRERRKRHREVIRKKFGI